jgi:predicted nucleic acid-binding protein
MIVVVDASVALKWFFQQRDDEAHVDRALALLTGLDAGRYRMMQPPHFLAEIGAVLAREKPEEAQADLADLREMDWRFTEDMDVYAMAVELAMRFRHHMFDTLYHAVALLDTGATLITADETYYRKAKSAGQITLLGDFAA